jgi:signal transduction histidine kinase
MEFKNNQVKIILVAILVLVITGLHIATSQKHELSHIFYRELYFLPLILSALWFGLRGAFITSLCITFVYLPYTIFHWQSLSHNDLDRLLEILLFNIVANGLGWLRDRKKTLEKEKRKAIMAMASTVAHEINTPLFSAIGTSQLLQEEFNPDSDPHDDLQIIIRNLKEISLMIKKIAAIENLEMKTYVGDSVIIDIEKSANTDNSPD